MLAQARSARNSALAQEMDVGASESTWRVLVGCRTLLI